MVSLTLTSNPLSISTPVRPPLLLTFSSSITHRHGRSRKIIQLSRVRYGTVRAELSTDAPVAVAIGACILNSLVFPIPPSPEEDDEPQSLIDSADARYAVMGIISFIPYFNWMSWVFAWLDTGNRRYAVYALAYLAPYLRTNLSISPEESWLPIASILLCIFHIQLEASIRSGDIEGLPFFSKATDKFTPASLKKRSKIYDEEEMDGHKDLPSPHEGPKDEIRRWGAPERSTHDAEYLNKDADDSEEQKH